MAITDQIAMEYAAVTESAGFLARPDIGVIAFDGDDAAEFLQGQLTNDVEGLEPGTGRYAALLTPKGKVRADMRVIRRSQVLLLLTEAERLPLVRKMIDTFRIGYRFTYEDVGEQIALLSVIGPQARAVLSQTVGLLDGLGENENDSAEIPISDPPAAAIVTLVGIDVLGDPTVIAALADQLRAAGVMEVSDAAAEIARVEAGIPRIGFELDENTIPQEAGINGRAVNFEKGCYVGQETVARLHYKGKPNRMLRGLRPETAVAPGAVITAPDGKELGHVGSAVVSPQYGPLALAIIRREVEAGDSVDVDGVSALVTEPGVHP